MLTGVVESVDNPLDPGVCPIFPVHCVVERRRLGCVSPGEISQRAICPLPSTGVVIHRNRAFCTAGCTDLSTAVNKNRENSTAACGYVGKPVEILAVNCAESQPGEEMTTV